MKMQIAVALLAVFCGVAIAADEPPKVAAEAPIVRAEPLDRTTLNPVYSEDWNLKDFKDEKLGLSITVVDSKKTDMAWRSSSSGVNESPFDKSDTTSQWLKQVKDTPDGTSTVYMKKSEATFKAVIEDRKMNLFLRYIALRDMDDLKFTPGKAMLAHTIGERWRNRSVSGYVAAR